MIKWTSDVRRFEGPSGQVAVNGDAGRWCVDRSDSDTLRAAVENALALPGSSPTPAWVALCRDVPTSGAAVDVITWVNGFLAMPPCTGPRRFSRPIRLLAELRLKGSLLWPTCAHKLPHPCGSETHLLAPDGKTPYEQELLGSLPRPLAGTGSVLMSCSPIGSVDEVCEPALVEALRVFSASGYWASARDRVIGLALFRALEGKQRSNGAMITVLALAKEVLHQKSVVKLAAKRFGEAADREDAKTWVIWFGRVSSETRRKCGYSQERACAVWLEFGASRGSIPAPSDTERNLHILGKDGFLAWLGGRSEPSTHSYRTHLRLLRETMAFMVSEGAMAAVPILSTDIPTGPATNMKSNKLILPRRLVEIAREIVRELLVAAFRQYDSLPDLRWMPAGNLLPNSPEAQNPELHPDGCLPDTLLTKTRFRVLLVTIRGSDGRLARIINPVLPASLLWLLRMPTRGMEVRFMDSGEADEFVPDVHLDIDGRPVADWRLNDHHLATAGRRQGAIRKILDPRSGNARLGFFVNTNKSQPGGHADGADRGREIPWEDPEMLTVFHRVRSWQGRVNPSEYLRRRDDVAGVSLRPSDGLRGRMPGYVFLFRHLQDARLGSRRDPPSHSQMAAFLKCLLDEAEARMSGEENAAQVGMGPADRIVLARRPRDGRPLRCAYSLHSLRVSGITAMSEDGLPFHILSDVVGGHQSWAMTAYYIKLSPEAVMDALAAARSLLDGGGAENEAAEAAVMEREQLENRFVSESDVVTATEGAQIAGMWLPMVDGVCPNGGTRCHDGGPPVDGQGRHGPVEGGQRNCGLCRFFLTGPAFLPGQVLMINGLLYRARREARSLQELWLRRRAEPNPGRRARIDDRAGHAEAAIDLTLRTVNARVRLLRKSQALAAAAGGLAAPSIGDMLITRLGETDVEVSLRAASELGFLDEVSRIAALVPELTIQDAPIERNQLIDRLLDVSGFEGLLFRLSPDTARTAGDAFTDAVRSLAPPGVAPGDHLDAVAEGRAFLLGPDAEVVAAEMSRALGIRMELRRRAEPAVGGGPAIGILPGPKGDEL